MTFATIDFASFEVRVTEQKYGPRTRQQERLVIHIEACRKAGVSITGRMTKSQPVRYLGHTYNSREIKD